MRAALERALSSRWYGRPGVLWLLWPLEGLFRLGAAWRRARRARTAPAVPVVVVGNLAVGGAGKTPLVIALVQAAQRRGLRVGVISRGYGGRGPFPAFVEASSSPHVVGDEPAMIAQRTGAPLVVDPDRVRALEALRSRGVDLVVSDDGLQHYRLPRTVEIAVVDARRRLGNGHCLPVGPLREPAARLASVDFVIGNGGDAGVCAVPMEFAPTAFRRLYAPSGARTPDAFVAGCGGHVEAFAGIGDPARFFAVLRALGLDVTGHPFPDHHAYVAEDFAAFAGRTLLMTAKDAVKCASLPGLENAWYLDIEARLPPGFMDSVLARAGFGADR